jgi:hypothetical protein
MAAAEKCTGYEKIDPVPEKSRQIEFAVAGNAQTQATESQDFCLRLSVSSEREAEISLSLPIKQGNGSVFENGRSIPITVFSGQQTIALVLPAYIRGKDLRVDLDAKANSHVTLQSIEVGRTGDEWSHVPHT